MYVFIYMYIYTKILFTVKNKVLKSDINDNTLLKTKTMKFEFEDVT